jgi:fimbrial chaperone protein
LRAAACALLLLCLSLLALVPGSARAAGFSVNPIHLELKPAQSATSLTVQNFNPERLLVQVRVYRWEHKDGAELLDEVSGDDAPLVTPPLFRLAPDGGSQVIRIGFQKPAAAPAGERQWRVIVEEVPQSNDAAAAAAGPATIAVHVRVSLPLLQLPQIVRQDLQWTLQRGAPGRVSLTAANLGTVTERLDEIRLGAKNAATARMAGPLYVFPGERRTFDLHPEVELPAGEVRLSVEGTPRPLTRELQLSAQ